MSSNTCFWRANCPNCMEPIVPSVPESSMNTMRRAIREAAQPTALCRQSFCGACGQTNQIIFRVQADELVCAIVLDVDNPGVAVMSRPETCPDLELEPEPEPDPSPEPEPILT